MSLTVLVASKTDAETSDAFYVPQNQAVSIKCVGNLVSAETVDVQISLDNSVFVDYEDGNPVLLNATKNALRLYGPAWYKVDKSVTASATAVQKLD